MNLITIAKPRDREYYINALTKEMDRHVIDELSEYDYTYIYGDKPDEFGRYPLRFPGATRGAIRVNKDNIIEEIEFCKETSYIYKDSVKEAVKKFVGCRIIIY